MSQWPEVWPRTRRWAAGAQPQAPRPPPWPANLFLQWEMGQGPPHHSHASRMSVAHSCTTLTLWHAIGPQLKKERSRDTGSSGKGDFIQDKHTTGQRWGSTPDHTKTPGELQAHGLQEGGAGGKSVRGDLGHLDLANSVLLKLGQASGIGEG